MQPLALESSSSTGYSLIPRTAAAPWPFNSSVDNLRLVFHIDILILSLFVFFFLWTIPRLVARLARPGERTSGLIFRSLPKKTSASNSTGHSQAGSVLTLAAEPRNAYFIPQISPSNTPNKPGMLPPPRVQSWSSRFHRTSSLLRSPAFPGCSIGRLVIFAVYFGIILYAGVYQSSPFSGNIRKGVVAMSQLPIIFALGTKNSMLGSILSISYEKLNFLHRFVGRLAFIAANMHALVFLIGWAINGVLIAYIQRPAVIHGLVTLMGIDLLAIFSLSFFRQNYYRLFLFAHISGFVIFPVGLALHVPVSIPYVGAGVGVYVLDHVIRLFKTRISMATLYPVHELGLTRVEVPQINGGWQAGQHLRLRIFSSGMGFLGWAEVHPFTIANVSGDGQGVVLMCKKAGDWTNKLFALAHSASGKGESPGYGVQVLAMLEGPYGGLGNTLVDGFSGALFVVGGSGITFALSAIQDLVQKDMQGKSRVKVIELVWSVQDIGSLSTMLSTFNSFIRQAPNTNIRISVFYTRASTSSHTMYENLHPSIVLNVGRPMIAGVLESVIDQTRGMSEGAPSGVFVGACGPAGLIERTRSAIGGVSSGRAQSVGGLELSEDLWVVADGTLQNILLKAVPCSIDTAEALQYLSE